MSRPRLSVEVSRRAKLENVAPRRLALAALVGASLMVPGAATADMSDRLGRVHALYDEVTKTPFPAAYVPLRKLWSEWDQGDPSEVEELLRALAIDSARPAPIRAYAGLLEAYARRRRGDLDGAQSRIAKLGYVGRWLVVGPFDNEGKGGLLQDQGPEGEQLAPIVLGKSYPGKERPVRWRSVPPVSPYAWFDFGVFLRPDTNVCGFATTFVRDARTKEKPAARPISIWAGSAGAMRVFWNGEEVIRDEKYRSLDGDRVAAKVTLASGWNQLSVKVCGQERAPMLSLRLATPDGSPDAFVETDPDPVHSNELPKKTKTSTKAAKVPKLDELDGPLPAFERMAKKGDAAALETFARWLVATSADDPADQRARELAQRAATLKPSIERLLLAGDLAENRNQRAEWIEKAEAILDRAGKKATEDERIKVTLARAKHVRTGANWRDAVPIFDKVLAIDPDDVTATLARVELYGEAGLRATALGVLERALERRPKSVALLRAMASALREQDRIAESDEMAERYSELRFDDPTFIRGRVELAIAKRDKPAATRWLDRLLVANPDSASSIANAARTYVALGERPRAISLYKRALDLAPEDTEVLKQLAHVHALAGQTDEQLKLLRRILELRPQDKEVREYVAHTEPQKPRPDEAYTRPASEFLKLRKEPANRRNRRTLSHLQVTTVFPNGLASRFHQVVFQPLTEAAAAEGREYSFGFQADTETVQLRGARVYRENGQIDEAIETGEGNVDNPSISMYSSARAYYVHFPRLQAGDVVEILYRVEDVAQRNAFADYFGEVAYMQSSEPIARSEYVLITPKSRTFYFNKPTVPGLVSTTDEAGESRIFRFTAERVPAIEPEPRQPQYGELLGHVHVSTYKTWEDVGRWYWGLVRDQFTPDDEVRRRVTELTKGLTTEREKVQAVYDYVVQKTRYVALEFGIHGFKPYRCAQIFARGFGDCKDKATLIVTMLKELGIPSTIVIVRTQHRGGFETEPASLAPFDHAIAYVPSLDLYLDGTAEFTGSTELPAMDRGAMAMQINEGKTKLVTLPDPEASASVVARKVEATVAADGGAQIDFRAEVTGVAASAWRRRYHADSARKQRVSEDLSKEFPGLEVTTLEANNMEDVEQSVSIRVKGKAAQLARRSGDQMSVPAGPPEYMVREYATLSTRKLDIKLDAATVSRAEWTVKVPAGAKIVGLPQGGSGTTPFGSFKVEVENAGNEVRVKTSVTLSKTRIRASEYAEFRAFCEATDKVLGARVAVQFK